MYACGFFWLLQAAMQNPIPKGWWCCLQILTCFIVHAAADAERCRKAGARPWRNVARSHAAGAACCIELASWATLLATRCCQRSSTTSQCRLFGTIVLIDFR